FPKLPQWYGDVKNAMRDKGMSVRQLAEETGYAISTVSQTINGRYSRRNYQAIAGRINSVLGTKGLPERFCAPSDEWCQSVKIGLIQKNMSVSQLAEAAGVTRDKMSHVINGRMMDQQVVNTVSRLLDIALPESASGMSKL
ncbi:helix-turn-helix domain-containing protein, partial [Sporofaciens musculi]|uniref:helix-turn-helix domain-containing protein n=1 Tax=Sporofaciens musculi TaxID=2681861 RepID=UPI0025706F35